MHPHEKSIERCIRLAKNGLGTTYPNPLVGSVIVLNDKIIGEGWHYRAGMPHAEVNAISAVKNRNELKNATLYVNLEPCSHYGKTPPCAALILKSGIKRVVIGNLDPNPKVAGRGIKLLKENGCHVLSGILEEACFELNKRFFTYHQERRPYIILKWAQTADGFMSPSNEIRKKQEPVWITNEYSRQRVHKMRAEEMAILVGTTTAIQDNPSLTTRSWAGSNPVRVVLDRYLKLPSDLQIFNDEAQTIVLTEKKISGSRTDIIYEHVDFNIPLPEQICRILYEREIQSVIVEGGAKTLHSFIQEDLWDEAHVFSAPVTFREGIAAPKISAEAVFREAIKEDQLTIFKKKR